MFWKTYILRKITERGDKKTLYSFRPPPPPQKKKIQLLAASVLITLCVSEKILNRFGHYLMINQRRLYYKRQSVVAV